ncbi:transcriptional regulator [Levilactobacillus koreensis JCM 16448]|uniref:HxlR family transcriptional regulator n=1 Tax=Levilactobacillus koreensis TaxID=637971 RepID=A0AAC8ZHA3_9LACO|nr:helix-turn-helix domain-containing protein [Levilactobacillus koreensis]AKP65938.1 HxlR family transcriptional regulator [Levilactobacillus koreensis]KRK90291.1 transcriptional regulator [Levilactobacillus koreensis JCM 16448]
MQMMSPNKQDESTVDFELCPRFEQTFSFLGKKWNGLIIDVLLQEGPQRFRDLARKIPRCSDRVLVERLKELELNGIVLRQTFPDNALIEYELTQKGQEFKDIMTAVHAWSDKWYCPTEINQK